MEVRVGSVAWQWSQARRGPWDCVVGVVRVGGDELEGFLLSVASRPRGAAAPGTGRQVWRPVRGAGHGAIRPGGVVRLVEREGTVWAEPRYDDPLGFLDADRPADVLLAALATLGAGAPVDAAVRAQVARRLRALRNHRDARVCREARAMLRAFPPVVPPDDFE